MSGQNTVGNVQSVLRKVKTDVSAVIGLLCVVYIIPADSTDFFFVK